jgi:hypothetical protein
MKLKSINNFLRKLKLLLVVKAWDGEGEKTPTELKLTTLKEYNKRYNDDKKKQNKEIP